MATHGEQNMDNLAAEETLNLCDTDRLEEDDRQRRRDEGSDSDSSDEDVDNYQRSEPALMDSVFVEQMDDEDDEDEERPEPLPHPQPYLWQQQPPVLDQRRRPQNPPAEDQPPQPQAKRPRGRPRKPSAEPQPPPRRPQPQKPVLDQVQKAAYKARCKERDIQMNAFKNLKHPTPAQVEGYWSLLVEDNIDESRCDGSWRWDDFTENKERINEDIIYTGGEGGLDSLSAAARRATTELDCLRLFFTREVVDNLVHQTNLYAQQEGAAQTSYGWTELGREEILAFLGVAVNMSMIKVPGEIQEYWTTEEQLRQPWFPRVMSGLKFRRISRFLHCNDNRKAAKNPDGTYVDKLVKIRPLITPLRSSFRKHFSPARELSIDEQMIGTKARCSFIQSMKDKPTKRGVKVWALCDARVHYCLNFQIYTGGTGETGLGFRVVNDMMCHYLGKGHHVYFDNFYTSPELMEHLISHNTLACGTVRHGRKNMPERLQPQNWNVEKGQTCFLTSHRVTACRWKDKRDVFCLSTVHGNTMKAITRRKAGGHGEQEEVQKPLAICEYNTYMGGVDVFDQLLSYHPTARRYKRWWVKIFWRLFDMAVLNALALWKLKYKDSLTRDYHKEFRLKLAQQLVTPLMERNVPVQPRAYRVADRLVHYGQPHRYGTQKACAVCRNRNSKTRFGCRHCGEGVRLHAFCEGNEKSCFVKYHTEY